MGSSERPQLSGGKETSMKPGPGAYDQSKILGKTAPTYGFGTENRPEVASKDQRYAPGPGAYAIPGVIGKDGPTKSMSPKLKDPYTEKNNRLVPGPGNYTISNAMMRTAPQFGFGTSTRKERRTSP